MMKSSVVAGFAVLSLVPAPGSACEYTEAATSASATPPAQLAAAPAPEASRAVASNATSTALKAAAPKKTAKQAVDKNKEASRSDAKVVALTGN